MKKNNKKPRTKLLKFNIMEDTKINLDNKFSIEINGLPQIDSGSNYVDIITYIDRRKEGKKSKVINTYSSVSKNIAVNEINLIHEYDAIFVVDTNTEIINGKRRCIGVVGAIKYLSNEGLLGLEKTLHLIYDIEIDDMNSEKYTWCMLIEMIQHSSTYSKDKRIGIVVDSFAGDILQYNKGKEILPGFILPDNFTLMYAGSDKKNDGILNWAISKCDDAANKLKINKMKNLNQ